MIGWFEKLINGDFNLLNIFDKFKKIEKDHQVENWINKGINVISELLGVENKKHPKTEMSKSWFQDSLRIAIYFWS